MAENKLRLLSFGAGAIGTYIGGRLAIHGHEIVVVERAETLTDLWSHGLRIHTRQGEYTAPLAGATASLAEALETGPFDYALVAVKGYDTEDLVDRIRPHTAEMPHMVSFQNGVENEDTLRQLVGRENVIAATVTSAIGRRGAGDIIVEKERGVGICIENPAANRLADALRQCGIKTTTYYDEKSMKWSKMLTNIPANAIAAILHMTAGEVYSHPAAFKMEVEMFREALRVMESLKIPVSDLPGTPVRLMAWLFDKLPTGVSRPLLKQGIGKGRGGKMPSFYLDLQSGKNQSEVEFLNGAIARIGELHQIQVPVNRYITETLMALVRGELPLDTYLRNPEKLQAGITLTLP